MLALLAALLITAVACGTDRAGDDSGVGASSFQVEGDTLTWAPPWDEGDTRSVSVTSTLELSDGAQGFFDSFDRSSGMAPEFPTEKQATVGIVSIISENSNGATGEFNLSITDLISQLETQTLEQPGFGEADFGQLSLVTGLVDQLDLGVEFGIENNGSLTGVTNLDELVETANELVDSLLLLATFADDEFLADEDVQELRTLLEELPKTDAVKLAADSALNLVTANLFLMRAGDYTVGQPVIVSGKTPTMIGLSTDGTFSYELTDVSGGTATMQVLVTPTDINLFDLMEQLVTELAPIFGEDLDDFSGQIPMATDRERAQFDAISSVAFNPYTVTLTLDTETGWVTAANWSYDLAFPEGFGELIEKPEDAFLGFAPEDIGVTIGVSATFEEVTAAAE